MRAWKLAALLALSAGAGTARADDLDRAAAKAQHLQPDQIVAKLHAINRLEIDMGRLARDKGASAEIRRFGALLERDHSAADKKVASLAKRLGVTEGQTKPDAADRKMVADLSKMSGADFDRAFVDHMKLGHDKALRVLGAASQPTNDKRLNDLIGRLMPIITQHDELAGKLQGKRLG